ncbi:hypothetical protein ACFFQF_09605 [Haladaptatus pallidirubidus]|uniref:Uncharacterized protein n=1 Tax=Haladaptatus pallidirubidus TaxID=1008152 RepID=A0AAV3UF72_9EURY|nr:hypothetical protein [Haladaptatus pallidirubidus]
MVSGAVDLAVTGGQILLMTLLSHRLLTRLVLHRKWPNPHVRILAVTIGSVLSGVTLGLGILSGIQ